MEGVYREMGHRRTVFSEWSSLGVFIATHRSSYELDEELKLIG
jgi:hypothetical protein